MNLVQLTAIPDNDRNQKWEIDFFQALSQGNLDLLSADPQQGPDGWPYLMAGTSDSAQESAQKVIHWLSTRGLGLVVNPQKDYPDYVFTYGMIWSFRETGFFYKNENSRNTFIPSSEKIDFDMSKVAHAGTPNETYLPGYARKILREFFRDQGLLQVQILLLSEDKIKYDLAFSLESLGNPKTEEHKGILEAISWFLPPHYSLMLVSEKGLPEFTAL